ncbi:cytidylyltransferase domain-containing protein [Desemzia sp. FAM 24101]|uniref:cytidylyltransferase domain-containing protein n=1 Tax=unclassified Desemzia TaxID=2685243 RepID=UPI00388B7247
MKILAIIPARGGSKGIPRKNVRIMSGKPLISYAIENALASRYDLNVCVSTDDEEIGRVSKQYGAEVIERSALLASDSITLDPVIYDAVQKMSKKNEKEYDIVITLQPTSPLLTSKTLDAAIEDLITYGFDTLISGVNSPHLAWKIENKKAVPAYKERLNRQYLPKNLIETGAFVITKSNFVTENSRFGKNISIYEMPENEAIDIDTPHDWWIAEKELSKKNILIRVDGYSKIGLGHVYRSLVLANNFIDHNVCFVLSEQSDIGIQKIKASHYKYEVISGNHEMGELIQRYNCDIVINDILNTDEDYIHYLKSTDVKVVNFEDLGKGSKYADIVINDLYSKQFEDTHYYWGSEYYLIRDEFLISKPSPYNEVVKEVLVIFGGSDPSNLTEKLFQSIQKLDQKDNIHFTFIIGLGYKGYEELAQKVKSLTLNIDVIQNVKMMTEYMKKADLAISSQGRTMLELAAMAVPTILMAQNKRELEHEFGYLQNGFINLGYGKDIEAETVAETISWLIKSPQIREQMRSRMLQTDLKNGLKKVLSLILD